MARKKDAKLLPGLAGSLAHDFLYTAYCAWTHGPKVFGNLPQLMYGPIVCLAFAVEILLKDAIASPPNWSVPADHNLETLWSRVPAVEQTEISSIYTTLLGATRNIADVARDHARAFEQWRYRYEQLPAGQQQAQLSFDQDAMIRLALALAKRHHARQPKALKQYEKDLIDTWINQLKST